VWSFTGKVSFLKNGYRDIITIATPIYVKGVSEAEALNHAKFVIRQNNGLPINTKIDLLDYSLKPPRTKQTKVMPQKPTNSQESGATQITFDNLF
jgi:hypothetical protein